MPQDKDTRDAASLASWDTLLRAETLRRILVTILVICFYRLGSQIPVPGLDLNILNLSTADASSLSIAARERFSIFALGLIPILSAMILGEFVKLVVPRLRAMLAASETTRTTYNRAILLAGLAFAAFQSYGVASALEVFDLSGNRLVPEPGSLFRLALMATLVAATALLMWLADIVTRFGLGSGMWIIVLYSSFQSFAGLPGDLQAGIDQGMISTGSAIAVAAALVAIVAVLAALYRARLPDDASADMKPSPEEPLRGRALTAWVWPPLVGVLLASYLPVLTWFLSGRDDAAWDHSIFAYGRPGDRAAVALLTYLLTLVMSPRGQGQTGRAAAHITGLTLAAIVTGITTISLNLPANIADGSFVIAMAVVCLAILPDKVAHLLPEDKPIRIDPAD